MKGKRKGKREGKKKGATKRACDEIYHPQGYKEIRQELDGWTWPCLSSRSGSEDRCVPQTPTPRKDFSWESRKSKGIPESPFLKSILWICDHLSRQIWDFRKMAVLPWIQKWMGFLNPQVYCSQPSTCPGGLATSPNIRQWPSGSIKTCVGQSQAVCHDGTPILLTL